MSGDAERITDEELRSLVTLSVERVDVLGWIEDWDFDEELGGTFAEDRARFGLAPLPYGPDDES